MYTNVQCPVCGALVFHYKHINGNTVYFEELGPPWPKHLCSNNTQALLTAPKLINKYKQPLFSQNTNSTQTNWINDISSNGFKWPSTLAYKSKGNIPEVDWPQVGMLKGVGYSVGANGLPTTERRELLSKIMSQQLPYVTSHAYRREWEEPNSTARLKKLANTIANLVKNSKRSSNNTSVAISEWEEDLKWLKENYYRNGKYYWSWPS